MLCCVVTGPQLTFVLEQVHVAGRSCTLSLYMPAFVRATFTFPKLYPTAAAAIEIERSTDMNLKTRALLLQGVRKLMKTRSERHQPSFEVALRFLLGDRSVLEDTPLSKAEDDDEDDDDEDGLVGDSLGRGPVLYNVPPPRRGGATFGPSGT